MYSEIEALMRARTYPRQAIALLTQHPITHLSMTVSEWVLETLFLLPCLLKSNIFGPLTEKKKSNPKACLPIRETNKIKRQEVLGDSVSVK